MPRNTDSAVLTNQRQLIITQPKLTDLDGPFWLAPMLLYVSQLRVRLNFGSAMIRLMGSVQHPMPHFAPCSTDMDPESVPLRL